MAAAASWLRQDRPSHKGGHSSNRPLMGFFQDWSEAVVPRYLHVLKLVDKKRKSEESPVELSVCSGSNGCRHGCCCPQKPVCQNRSCKVLELAMSMHLVKLEKGHRGPEALKVLLKVILT